MDETETANWQRRGPGDLHPNHSGSPADPRGDRASLPVLVLAIVAAGAVLVTFVFTTLIHESASIVTMLAIVVLSIGLDNGWKHSRPSRSVPV
jgi:hypothetical protein